MRQVVAYQRFLKAVMPKSGRGCLTRSGRQRELKSYFRVAVSDPGEGSPFFLDQPQGLDPALCSRLWEVSMEIRLYNKRLEVVCNETFQALRNVFSYILLRTNY